MDRGQLNAWIRRYENAWRTPGTDALGELFTADATYSTAPYENPHRGLHAIREMWEAERSGPDEEFEMTGEVVAVEGDTGVARVHVVYGDGPDTAGRENRQQREYRDLWVVRMNGEGRCFHFEEWPFWPSDQDGAPAAGAE
jgi:uncharacterized protein (TIGR02246 family)